MTNYVELHAHTEFSNLRFLDCIVKTSKLIDKAIEIGLKGIAITDHECLSSHIRALKYYKNIKKNNPDFKLILGNEIYLIDEVEIEEKIDYNHFILLAKDDIGYRYIRELSSKAWERNYYKRGQERVPTLYSDFKNIVKEKNHLIGMTACLGGKFAKLVSSYLATNDEKYKYEIDNFINWGISIFGEENFYVELQPALSKEQIDFNKKALQIAKFYKLKWTITNDVHYLTKEQRTIHESYLNSREDSNRELADFYESTYLKKPEEVLDRMKDAISIEDINKGIENTYLISNEIEEYDIFQDVKVFELDLKEKEFLNLFRSYEEKYPFIKKYRYSNYKQDRLLLQSIEQGFVKLNLPVNEQYISRINEELEHLYDVSEKLNQRLSAYYVSTQELVKLLWEFGTIVGAGRGSTCAFLISYILEISQVNPMIYNLPAWRHVHKTKVELSD